MEQEPVPNLHEGPEQAAFGEFVTQTAVRTEAENLDVFNSTALPSHTNSSLLALPV